MATKEDPIEAVKQRLKNLTSKTKKETKDVEEEAPVSAPQPQPRSKPESYYTYEEVRPSDKAVRPVVEAQSPPSVPIISKQLDITLRQQPPQKPQLPPLPPLPSLPSKQKQEINDADEQEEVFEVEEDEDFDEDEEYDEDKDELEKPETKMDNETFNRIQQLEVEMARLERNGAFRAEVLFQLLQTNTALNRISSSLDKIASIQEKTLEQKELRRIEHGKTR
jgi:hypothetical protein